MEHLTSNNFDNYIDNEKRPIIVDFWAEWCGPCKMMHPILESIENSRTDIAIAKVNVDNAPELSVKFGITSIPAFILFKSGEIVKKTVGYMSAEELIAELNL